MKESVKILHDLLEELEIQECSLCDGKGSVEKAIGACSKCGGIGEIVICKILPEDVRKIRKLMENK